MVDFNEFMSIALTKCGSDSDTFSELVELWNDEKEQIRGLDADDLEGALNCP